MGKSKVIVGLGMGFKIFYFTLVAKKKEVSTDKKM